MYRYSRHSQNLDIIEHLYKKSYVKKGEKKNNKMNLGKPIEYNHWQRFKLFLLSSLAGDVLEKIFGLSIKNKQLVNEFQIMEKRAMKDLDIIDIIKFKQQLINF